MSLLQTLERGNQVLIRDCAANRGTSVFRRYIGQIGVVSNDQSYDDDMIEVLVGGTKLQTFLSDRFERVTDPLDFSQTDEGGVV